MELIEGEPLVSKVSTEPGETNQTFHDKITGNNTENTELGEGTIFFDVIFYVRMKDGVSRIINFADAEKLNFKESIVIADMLWQWILNEIVSLQQKSSLWNTQGAFCIFLFFCAISIDDRLNLFHQSIIIVLIINPAEHRITYNITISIDQYCCRKCHDIGRVFPCI